jgi:hypothetical protein
MSGLPRIDFKALNEAVLPDLLILLERWLPDGEQQGAEWIALNPRRDDCNPGSFKVNLRSGRWADFATGDRGSDVISLAAFLFNISQIKAARQLQEMLGVYDV